VFATIWGSGCILRICSSGSAVSFRSFAHWERGLVSNSLSTVRKSFGPPLASKMHSHLVEPARVLALAWAMQKGLFGLEGLRSGRRD